jgi:hypothetical protein
VITTELNRTTQLVAEDCINCGTWFAMEATLREQRIHDGKSFHCPNGHPMVFSENDSAKLRKARTELERANARADRNARWLREEEERRQASERSASALRGVVTRTKRRVGNGTCPCCNRTFQQLARHMHAKHPDYAESEAGA